MFIADGHCDTLTEAVEKIRALLKIPFTGIYQGFIV